MSEHTYCDRCGMEITGKRHCMGEGATGQIFPWFHPKFDLCGGCFKDWKNWLPRSTRPEPDLDAPVQVEQDAWVELPTPNGETPYIRISRDGEKVQERSQEGRWNDYDAWWIKAAFRVAQAEHEALREQVRALVEEILSIPLLQIARGGWLERLHEAAKRVQL